MKMRIRDLRGLIREAVESSVVDELMWGVKDVIFDRHEDLEAFRDEAESMGIVALGDLMVNVSKMDPRISKQRSVEALRSTLERVVERGNASKLQGLIRKWLKGEGGVKGGKIFGDVAFADQRKGVPKEPNTEIEQEVWQDMNKHVSKNFPMKTRTTRAIRSVLQKDLYKDVLQEPDVPYVYRGLKLNRDTLEKILGRSLTEDELEGGRGRTNFTVIPNVTYFSDDTEEGTTSWTIDSSVAKIFSQVTGPDRPYAVILVASVSQNPDQFIVGPGAYYKVDGWAPYTYEKEATALGPIRSYKVYWQNKTASSPKGRGDKEALTTRSTEQGYTGKIDEE